MFVNIVLLQFYSWEGHGTLLYATQHTPNPISNKANHCGQVNLTKIRPLSTNHFFKPMLPYKTKASVFVQGWSSQQHLSPFQYHSTVHSTEHLARFSLFHTMFVDIFQKKWQISSLIFLLWVSLLRFSEICKGKQYLKLIDLPRNNRVLWIIIFPIPWIEILMQPVLSKIWPITSKNTDVVPSLCFINI